METLGYSTVVFQQADYVLVYVNYVWETGNSIGKTWVVRPPNIIERLFGITWRDKVMKAVAKCDKVVTRSKMDISGMVKRY